MTASARLLTSVEPDQRQRFSELAAAQGVSSSRLLARLVHRALIENPEEKVKRLLEEAAADKAPAEKYTVRLMGLDAARLESRAVARGVTASGYVAHVLRAHLRADPPMGGERARRHSGRHGATGFTRGFDPGTRALAPRERLEAFAGAKTNPREGAGHAHREFKVVGGARCLARRPFRDSRDVPAPIYRAAHRQRQIARPREASALGTPAGDSVFMRRKLEAVKRELRTRGKVADRDSYRPPSRKTARLGW